MITIKKFTKLMALALVLFQVNAIAGDQTPIYDIQYTESADGASTYDGDVVTTSGIVTGTWADGYYIQDGAGAWNGIYVYDFDNTPAIGDLVIITGEVSEFFELTEMTYVSTFTVDSSDNTMPEPTVVSTADATLEMYEGVLIRLMDVECTNSDSGFGQWIVNDGSGDVFVDDQMYGYNAVQGTHYNITGVLTYNFDEWKVEPRSEADIEIFTSVEENEFASLSLYPNPVTEDKMWIKGDINGQLNVEVYSFDGRLVESIILEQFAQTIDLSNLSQGTYVLRLSNDQFNKSISIEKK